MWAMDKLFVYTKLVLLLVGRIMVKLLHMGTSRFVKMARCLVSMPRVDLQNGDKQLLPTESVDAAVQKDLADEWVAVSDEDNWEPGGRNLLDENQKRSRGISESNTEDELIELSEGEDRTTLFTSLQTVKRASTNPFSDRATTKLTAPNSTMLFL